MGKIVRISAALAVTLAAVVTMLPPQAIGQLPSTLVSQDRRVATLNDQLVAGLRATRPEQKEFIAKVVRAVDEKRLDHQLVSAVFVWSRRRWPPMPFPYFERAMRIEAAKRGVALPKVSLVIRPGAP